MVRATLPRRGRTDTSFRRGSVRSGLVRRARGARAPRGPDCGMASRAGRRRRVPLGCRRAAAAPPMTERLGLFTGRGVMALLALFGVNGVDELLRSLALDRQPDDPAASPQCQILRDLSPTATPELGTEVSAIGERSAREDPASLSRWRAARAAALDAARPATSPVHAGCLAARELRRDLGLD